MMRWAEGGCSVLVPLHVLQLKRRGTPSARPITGAVHWSRQPLNVSKSTSCLNGLEDSWEAGVLREPSLASAIKGSFVDLLASAPLDSSVR